jgi:hypothetical protein
MQFDYVSKVITHSKLWVGSVFLKCHFFLSNVHHSFAKLERILMLMIKTSKGVENFDEIQFITHLNSFGSNMFWPKKS